MSDLYAGYYDDTGQWLTIAPDWSDIDEAPRHRAWRLWDDDGAVRLGFWGEHAETGKAGWLSAVDPLLSLNPRWFRDLVKPPHIAAAEVMAMSRLDRALIHAA